MKEFVKSEKDPSIEVDRFLEHFLIQPVSLDPAGIISKLSEDESKAFAVRVRELAQPLRQAVDAAATPRARVALLRREKMALARAAQMELAHVKRLYKTEGFSEADIHTVIPDRPPSGKGKGGASEGGPSGGVSAG